MNYISRFGLEYNPFIKNSKDVIFESNEAKEVKHRLEYLCHNKGFGIITGPPGVGKTSTLRNWANSLNRSIYKVIYLSLSTVTVLEFYRNLARELDCEVGARKNQNFVAIQEAINRLVFEKKMTPVIILDEANYLLSGVLNDLKMLFNFEMDSKDRAVVILAGLPSLNNTLRLTANEPLRQRITMNYNIDALSYEEAKNYILLKLSDAGCHNTIFDDSCFSAIANGSNGIPRVINKIVDHCLLIGDSLKVNIINNEIVMKAINDIVLD